MLMLILILNGLNWNVLVSGRKSGNVSGGSDNEDNDNDWIGLDWENDNDHDHDHDRIGNNLNDRVDNVNLILMR